MRVFIRSLEVWLGRWKNVFVKQIFLSTYYVPDIVQGIGNQARGGKLETLRLYLVGQIFQCLKMFNICLLKIRKPHVQKVRSLISFENSEVLAKLDLYAQNAAGGWRRVAVVSVGWSMISACPHRPHLSLLCHTRPTSGICITCNPWAL